MIAKMLRQTLLAAILVGLGAIAYQAVLESDGWSGVAVQRQASLSVGGGVAID